MKVLKGLLPVCALFLVSAPATAAGSYFGLAFGQATVADWDTSVIDDGSLTSASAEDSDTSFRVLGGYEINENIAIEVGYSDFGEATAEGTSNGTGFFWVAGPVSAKVEADGLDFGFVAKVPISDAFAVFGKLGILMWDGKFTFEDSSGPLSGSDDGNDVFFGLGAQFNTTSALAMRADYTMYSLDDTDLDTITVSLVYRVPN